MLSSTSNYIPPFFLNFWLSSGGVHVYDVCNDTFIETHQPPTRPSTIFKDLYIGCLDGGTRRVLNEAEEAFARLECRVQLVLRDILQQTVCSGETSSENELKKSLPFAHSSVDALQKYFTFLRFRNSKAYRATLRELEESYRSQTTSGELVYAQFHPLIVQCRLRNLLRAFIESLNHSPQTAHGRRWCPGGPPANSNSSSSSTTSDAFHNLSCWALRDIYAEIVIGVASDGEEYIFSDRCFGALDDEGCGEDSGDYGAFCVPICPTVAIYILGTSSGNPLSESTAAYRHWKIGRSPVWLDISRESGSDMRLRNALVLQSHPMQLYFRSLRGLVLSISVYDELGCAWSEERRDYSRLKQRCRQVVMQLGTKTLTVEGSLTSTDMADHMLVVGSSNVAIGSFSWKDPMERQPWTVNVCGCAESMKLEQRTILAAKYATYACLPGPPIAWAVPCVISLLLYFLWLLQLLIPVQTVALPL